MSASRVNLLARECARSVKMLAARIFLNPFEHGKPGRTIYARNEKLKRRVGCLNTDTLSTTNRVPTFTSRLASVRSPINVSRRVFRELERVRAACTYRTARMPTLRRVSSPVQSVNLPAEVSPSPPSSLSHGVTAIVLTNRLKNR